MRFLPGNAQHIGARHSQQDSFGFSDLADEAFLAHGGFLAIICDGMGGMEYGDAASKIAVRAFLEAYLAKTPEESIPVALERSVFHANHQVVSFAQNLGLSDGIGTTLIAAVLHSHSLYFISVGDSGLFFVRGGQFEMINRPHIFANILDAAVARGTLSREDAESHPERESLTSYIGAEKLNEIDRNVDSIPIHAGDVVLLASDGLFKTLHREEIRACFEGNPQAWPELLVERTLAKQREYQDNVTVLSVAAEPDEHEPVAMLKTMQLDSAIADSRSDLMRARLELPNTIRFATAAAAPATAREEVPPPAIDWTPPAQSSPTPVSHPKTQVPWLLIIVLILAAAGAGGWYYFQDQNPRATDAKPATPVAGEPTPAKSLLPSYRPPSPSATDPPTPDKPVGKQLER